VEEARGDGILTAANLNAPLQTVVSGDNAALDRFAALAGEQKLRTVRLAVGSAFHSSMMQPASEKMRRLILEKELGEARQPVYTNLTGGPVSEYRRSGSDGPQTGEDLADMLAGEGWDLTNPAWREHPYFRHNQVTAEADRVAERTDGWLHTLGYERNGPYYRCTRPDDAQKTVALFSHGGSSAAAMGHILNLPFPYACGLFHLEFTGVTVIRLDRNPGRQTLPCLELANDGRHIHGTCYHRLADM
jgi:hypothetical protein